MYTPFVPSFVPGVHGNHRHTGLLSWSPTPICPRMPSLCRPASHGFQLPSQYLCPSFIHPPRRPLTLPQALIYLFCSVFKGKRECQGI